jgi:hypothetical protein
MNYMNISVKFQEFRYYRCIVLLLVYSLSSLFSYFSRIEKFVVLVYNQFRNYFNNSEYNRSIIKVNNLFSTLFPSPTYLPSQHIKCICARLFHSKVCATSIFCRERQRSEDRGWRTEVRGQRTEVRGRRSEDGGQRSEVRGQRSEVRGQRSEVRGQRSEVRGQRSEDGGQRTEVRGQRSEVRGQTSDFRFPISDFRFFLPVKSNLQNQSVGLAN